ncbi:hypothetical protein CLOM_g23461 [Closterium sp. NIES-68]|nr:hypothetical protein CLOM_g23461 [Closterium sp. NIES-68]GJP80644.1 hypothetical protein CLOP_g10845 [Closterium sp. NIES-67]
MIATRLPPLSDRAAGTGCCSTARLVSTCDSAAGAEARARGAATRGSSARFRARNDRSPRRGRVRQDPGHACLSSSAARGLTGPRGVGGRPSRRARAIIASSIAPAGTRAAASWSFPRRPQSIRLDATAAGAGGAAEEAVERMVAWARGEEGVWSVVIPTHNRLPILVKCLRALEQQVGHTQAGVRRYEVVVVDDGSTDGTVRTLAAMGVGSLECGGEGAAREAGEAAAHSGGAAAAVAFPHVRLLQQQHGGATAARNHGVGVAAGSTMVFIDSDMVVCRGFLAAHARALAEASSRFGDDRTFSYGRVVNTSNFHDPMAEPFKLTDYSAAFFATGNVAISRRMLAAATLRLTPPSTVATTAAIPPSSSPNTSIDVRSGVEEGAGGKHADRKAQGVDAGGEGRDGDRCGAAEQQWQQRGPFDAEFSSYGWEDLELGERLRQCGARIWQCPEAVGFHWHPPFHPSQLPALIRQERQRGENGVRFFLKHHTLNVRLMVQMTPLHAALWFLLTLGGSLNEHSLAPLLAWLVQQGHPGMAMGLLSPVLNWHTVQATREEVQRLRKEGVDV